MSAGSHSHLAASRSSVGTEPKDEFSIVEPECSAYEDDAAYEDAMETVTPAYLPPSIMPSQSREAASGSAALSENKITVNTGSTPGRWAQLGDLVTVDQVERVHQETVQHVRGDGGVETVDCYTKEISVSVYDLNDNNSIASDSIRSPHTSSRAALPSASAVNFTSSPSVLASPAVRAPTPTPMPTSLRDCYNELERCLELYQHDNLVESFAVLNDLVRTLDQLSAQAALHDEGFMTKVQRLREVVDSNADVIVLRKEQDQIAELLQRSKEEKGWESIENKRGVRTSIKEADDGSTHTIRLEGDMHASLFHVLAVANETDLLPALLPNVRLTVTKLRQISERKQLLHLHLKLPWPLTDRDAVITIRGVDMLHEGFIAIIGESVSWDSVDIPRPVGDTIRLEIRLFGSIVRPVNMNQTNVVSLCHFEKRNNVLPSVVLSYFTKPIGIAGFAKFREQAGKVKGSAYEERIAANPRLYDTIYKRMDHYLRNPVVDFGVIADTAAAAAAAADEVVTAEVVTAVPAAATLQSGNVRTGESTAPTLIGSTVLKGSDGSAVMLTGESSSSRSPSPVASDTSFRVVSSVAPTAASSNEDEFVSVAAQSVAALPQRSAGTAASPANHAAAADDDDDDDGWEQPDANDIAQARAARQTAVRMDDQAIRGYFKTSKLKHSGKAGAR